MLGQTADYSPPVVSERTQISVLPSKMINIHGTLTTAERATLERYATEETDSAWQFSVEKMAVAIEDGFTIEAFREFLMERNEQSLPEVVDGLLRIIEENYQAVKITGEALIIECANEKVTQELFANRHVAKLCVAAENRKLVTPAGKENAFRKLLNTLGYGMQRK